MDDPVDYCEFRNASLRLLTIRDDIIIIISMRIARFLVAIPRGIYDRRFRYGSTEKYHSSPRGSRCVRGERVVCCTTLITQTTGLTLLRHAFPLYPS